MRIIIGGDFSNDLSGEPLQELSSKNAEKVFDKGVLRLFKTADELVVNLECAVTESENRIKKFGPHLKAPFGTCEVLKGAGVTFVTLSNNHIFDFGKEGVKDTMRELDKNGIKYTGYGKNEADSRNDYIIERDGLKIAVIDVCEHEYTYALENREGARPYDPYDTSDDIAAAKKKADYVIVVYHGGKEFCRYPSPRLYKLCRSMIKHGADVVLCQHSHCVGCYENYEGGHILYGQGNFYFIDKRVYGTEKEDLWNNGLAVVLDVDKSGIKFTPVPVVMKDNMLYLAEGKEKDKILNGLKERGKTLADGSYINGWRAFCDTVPWYKTAVPPENTDMLGHWLDCEAHYDVLRELYKTYNHTNELD